MPTPPLISQIPCYLHQGCPELRRQQGQAAGRVGLQDLDCPFREVEASGASQGGPAVPAQELGQSGRQRVTVARSPLPISEFSVRGTGLGRWTGFLPWHVGKHRAGTELLSDCKAMAQLRDTHTGPHTLWVELGEV